MRLLIAALVVLAGCASRPRVERAPEPPATPMEELARARDGTTSFASSARWVQRIEELWPSAGPNDRAQLYQYLLENRTVEATEALRRRYPEVERGDLRSCALYRFGSELHEPALPVLDGALLDREERVRGTAREAIGKFKAQREALAEVAAWKSSRRADTIEDLVRLLGSENREVVIGAVRSLGALRAKDALPVLVRLLERDDAALREAVHEAICRLEN